MNQPAPESQPLPPPLPAHLPPPWSDPLDTTRFFERDLVHFPQPVSLLDFELIKLVLLSGMRTTTLRFSAPVRAEPRRFWTHVYTMDIFYCDPSEARTVWTTSTRAAFAPLLEDLEAYWLDVWLPEIRASQAFWDAFDLPNATTEALLAHVAESVRRIARLWELHFEIVYAVGHAWELFNELYMEVVEQATGLAASKLLQGFDNQTTAAGRAIWRLRDLATASPALAANIAASEPSELPASLAASSATQPEAAALLAALREYLARFGRRSTTFSLSTKTLIEDPTPVLSQLKDALSNPDADPDRHREERIAERDRAVAEVMDALRHYPRAVRSEFERRLETAQVATRLKEDHNFIIDFECTAALRAVLMELGRRLAVADVISAAEDIVHLSLEELQASGAELGSIASAAAARDRRALVASRAAEMERFRTAEVPTTIGVRPGGAVPADAQPDGVEPTATQGMFKGVGISAGVARGRVRVARTFDAAHDLRPGEVLVATSTNQPWTPLFATAAALVTEVGGVLSHVGVVTREYRLPAVSGIVKVTDRLSDGMFVEVDGTAGTVRILAEG